MAKPLRDNRPNYLAMCFGAMFATAIVIFWVVLTHAKQIPEHSEPTTVTTVPVLSAEDRFIQRLDSMDFPYTSRERVIEAGKTLCEGLAQHGTLGIFMGLKAKFPNLTDDQVMVLISASNTIFCNPVK